MKRHVDSILGISLLNSLTENEVITCLNNGMFKIISYGKNSVIHLEGETCTKLELILSGKVVIDRIDESGNLLTISEFYSKDILGGNLLFSKNPYYPLTVSAQLPTKILEIGKEVLFDLLNNNPLILRTYLESISDHTYILGDKIRYYVNKPIRDRIMNYLKHESMIQQSKHINLTITKKALAEKIGVQRTSLSRELAKMKKDGLITFDANSITIIEQKY